MAEQIAPYALTTRQRVKERFAITSTSFDVLLDRIISGMTDFIEGECNRRFKKTTYTNEMYSVNGSSPRFIFLKQTPVILLTSLEYRAGAPSNPSWTNFLTDNYELLEDGRSGIIRMYSGISSGINQIRATYDAGYLIDFANAGTGTHTLPFDLTDLCERLVTKVFKKREAEGRSSESYEGGTVSWKELLDDADKATINRYRRLPAFA